VARIGPRITTLLSLRFGAADIEEASWTTNTTDFEQQCWRNKNLGSLEIRAVTDAADKEAPQRFHANLPIAMATLASLLRLWLE